MRLVWYQRGDGLWNAACACNAVIAGMPDHRRAGAEEAHFAIASMERVYRAKSPDCPQSAQVPPCGPKLPEPNPNLPYPFVFP